MGGNLRGGRKVSDIARHRATIRFCTLLTHALTVGCPLPLSLLVNDLYRLSRGKCSRCPAD